MLTRLVTSMVLAFVLAPHLCIHSQTSVQYADDLATQRANDLFVYGSLFARLIAYQQVADESQGMNSDLQSVIPDELGLDSTHAALLEQIALDCQHDLDLIDQEAAGVIETFRKNARVNGSTPPPDLETLEALEQDVVLRYRDILQNKLGTAVDKNIHEMFSGPESTLEVGESQVTAGVAR